MFGSGRKRDSGGPFEFRVSDVVEIPLRGTMLRLRLLDGRPRLADLAVGERLQLQDVAGAQREIVIKAHPVTGGRPSQDRLERTREFDVLIEKDPTDAVPIEIGWTARGPVA
jgi:hypothetical protein